MTSKMEQLYNALYRAGFDPVEYDAEVEKIKEYMAFIRSWYPGATFKLVLRPNGDKMHSAPYQGIMVTGAGGLTWIDRYMPSSLGDSAIIPFMYGSAVIAPSVYGLNWGWEL